MSNFAMIFFKIMLCTNKYIYCSTISEKIYYKTFIIKEIVFFINIK